MALNFLVKVCGLFGFFFLLLLGGKKTPKPNPQTIFILGKLDLRVFLISIVLLRTLDFFHEHIVVPANCMGKSDIL